MIDGFWRQAGYAARAYSDGASFSLATTSCPIYIADQQGGFDRRRLAFASARRNEQKHLDLIKIGDVHTKRPLVMNVTSRPAALLRDAF
jgi:hypothetical protein